MKTTYFKGRGAQLNTPNPFLKQYVTEEHPEGLDEPLLSNEKTEVFIDHPKTVVNKINSPDVGMTATINPYQGCEHGCVYCYARNAHTYYGFSAGLDFERKIMVKPGAPELLRKHLDRKHYRPEPITLSGNTDCYQPLERKYRITRGLLEVMCAYNHPVGIITKNSLILRDTDLLAELAQKKLVHVIISVTSLREPLRRMMEPRTATYKNRMHTIATLSSHGIPVGVMNAPVIPGLNSDEIPRVIEAAAAAGARSAAYTLLRLNGAVGTIFRDWLYTNMPDRADKVWHQVEACHGGKVSDSRFGARMRGEGKIAESIKQLFLAAKKKYFTGRTMPPYDLTAFKRPVREGEQLGLF